MEFDGDEHVYVPNLDTTAITPASIILRPLLPIGRRLRLREDRLGPGNEVDVCPLERNELQCSLRSEASDPRQLEILNAAVKFMEAN